MKEYLKMSLFLFIVAILSIIFVFLVIGIASLVADPDGVVFWLVVIGLISLTLPGIFLILHQYLD